MKQTEPINLLIYRWRYVIGYTALVVVFGLAITLAGLYAPGGISQSEINAIGQTMSLSRDNINPINLPFHLLQLLSFKLFGVSHISIKLPAMLLAIGAIVAIFMLLKRWFKSNITILTMTVMAATSQLVFLAQSATPNILYVLYSVLILLFSSLILQKANKPLLWKILLVATVGISMYTPYFFYINLGLLIAAVIHPRTRYHLFKKSERINWIISGAVLLALITPLVLLAIDSPALLKDLSVWSQVIHAGIVSNAKDLVKMYLSLTPTIVGSQIAPLFDFASIFIIILGAIAMFRQSYTARSYQITAWLVLAAPILLINPSLISVVIVPLFILLAIGIETLLNEWYKLFPKNPYARTAGLVLAIGLISVMVFSGIDRFINGYRHMPEAVAKFSIDLNLLDKHLAKHPARVQLITGEEERPLYQAYAKYNDIDIVVSKPKDELVSTNVLVSRQAKADTDTSKIKLTRVITSDRSSDADRFYLYKAD